MAQALGSGKASQIIMTRKLISIGYSILATCALAQPAPSPQDLRTRQAWNKNWLSRRWPGAKTVIVASPTSGDEACVGITLWRLRPSLALPHADVRERIAGSDLEWTPVRVAVGTPLPEGDKLRMSVETTRNGYLYVLGREVFADGGKGNASLLYPAPGSDNHLPPGAAIQIPGSSFFNLTRERNDEVSETLTILILPEHIVDPLNVEKLIAWESRWKVRLQSLEQVDQIGKPVTRAEMQSGRNVLTQDDPLPQTMFRCQAKIDDPVVFDVSLPIQKVADVTARGIGIGVKSRPTPAPSEAPPATTPKAPLGRISGLTGRNGTNTTTRPTKRVTASDFLTSSQTEAEGYGLYSYILFGARPESLSSERWRRYYEAVVAYLDIPTIGEVSRYVPPASTNLTFLPVALAENELPAAGLAPPIQFRFDVLRLATHEALHKASGKQSYHDSSNGATACMLVGNYDFARAQGLLALLPNSHMEGPYIISVAEPLSRARALPTQYLYQDLSSVPPELTRLWVKEFMAQAQENEFWKTRSKDQFVLRLRTAIGMMSQQIPDFGKSITWTFISVQRR
jgi:hypothetical protein